MERQFSFLYGDKCGDEVTFNRCNSFAEAYQMYKHKGHCYYKAVVEGTDMDNIVRYIIDSEEYYVECCPHCEHETFVKGEFRKQYCIECGEYIKPCTLCDHRCDCTKCPLDGEFGHLLGGLPQD